MSASPLLINEPVCDAAAGLGADSTLSAVRRGLPARASLRVVTALSVAGLLFALAWPMLVGQVYLADDLGDYHLPLRAFYARQLAAGQPFDWCPDLYCGYYATGEGQMGGYHPLHWLLYRFLPLWLAFDVECLISYPLMLAGMYVLLRRWRLGREAALFGGMAFTFGGFNLLHFVHPNAVAVVAHLPWLLLAIDVLVGANDWRLVRLSFIAIALLTASQLLLGYPQYVFFSVLVEGTSAAALILLRTNRRWFRLLCWTIAVGAGALVAAVQLLPTVDALIHSARRDAGETLALQGSLHPLNLVQLVGPYLFATRVVGQNTHELGLYCGAVPLVAAAFAVLTVGERKNRKFVLLALAAAAAAALWALGEHGPLAWIESHLPIANRFRFPCRGIVVLQLALAVLAALGLGQILRRCVRSRGRSEQDAMPAILWTLPVGSAAIAGLSMIVWPDFVAGWPLVLAGPALITAATVLIWFATRGTAWAPAALVAFAAIDLGIYGLSHSVLGKTETVEQFVQSIDTPPGLPTSRVAVDLVVGSESSLAPRIGNRILLRGWNRVDGYSGLEPARQLDYREPAALRGSGTGWIAPEARLQMIDLAGERPSSGWISLTDLRPRTWVVTRAIVSANPRADITRISPAREALVENSVDLPGGPAGDVSMRVDQPGKFAAAVEGHGQQLLVVGESYHGGWRGMIDGQQTDILRVNGDFLGVVVPAGKHEVGLEFQPDSLRLGRWLSCFGLGLIVVVLVAPAPRGTAPSKRQP